MAVRQLAMHSGVEKKCGIWAFNGAPAPGQGIYPDILLYLSLC